MKFLRKLLIALVCLACSNAIHAASTPLDTDGDGVNDYREGKDGTDPNNASSFNSLSKGLVAYYPFNGNANDESGNGKHLTGSFNAEFTASNTGVGEALKTTSSTGASSAANSGITGNQPRTFSAWIKSDSPQPWPQGYFLAMGYGGYNGNASTFCLNSTFITTTNTEPAPVLFMDNNYANVISPTLNGFHGKWNHVVVTYENKLSSAKVFVNGSEVATSLPENDPNRSLNTADGRIVISSVGVDPNDYHAPNGRGFAGAIDDVRIYNRSLSATEVSQLYAKESAKPVINYQNSIYTFVEGSSWGAAETNSTKLGGHLVTVNNAFEESLIYNSFGKALPDYTSPESPGGGLWIGLTDNSGEGVYRWVNGEQSNWFESTNKGKGGWINNSDSFSQDYIIIRKNSLNPKGYDWDDYWESSAGWSGTEVAGGIAEIPFVRYGGSAYVVVQGPTWEEAESNAIKLGGHLVAIDNAQENAFLKSAFLDKIPASEEGMYIGYRIVPGSNAWSWIGESGSGYVNWATGAPNGAGVEKYSVIGITGAWDDWTNRQGPITRGIAEIKLPEENMVTVQGGTLPQGSELAGQSVGTFQISKFETTWGEWKAVRDWAVVNGYTDLAGIGAGSADNHPVRNVSWYDAVKWCNAMSEKNLLEPVYTAEGKVYRTGSFGFYAGSEVILNAPTANGYRLPTDAEWEWAARGGIKSHGYSFSGGNDGSIVGWFQENSANAPVNLVQGRGTWPVGLKLPNELDIFDMSGNVLEWVEDIWSDNRYRRVRGSNWNYDTQSISYRGSTVGPGQSAGEVHGFRLARNSGTPDTTAPVIAITSISANARLTSANATFGGTITETDCKPTLQYRLGTTGNWTASAVGGSASPYSFSQLVALKPGPNTVQFQAKDDAGNTSALASVNVSYVVASTLSIPAPNAADGSVTSGFGGSTSREVGVSYSVTATPASGMVFKEWLKNGVSAGTNATLTFTMQPGLTLKPVFVPDFAKLGGFYNGLVGVGAIGNGTAADMQAFAVNNGFIQITSGTNGSLSGVLKIEGKSHSFNGTMGANKRATISVPRSGKSNATLSLNLVSALPGEISGNVTTSGAPLAFRALRAAYTAGAAKHALAGKRYAIVLPPPSGLAMGYGHATLTVQDNGAAVLSGMLANGQAVNAGARIVDDGAGNWVFPVYVGESGIFTGEIVIPKTTPATGSELGGSLEWLKPASNTGLFKSGFLKSLQPLGATHSMTSAGLGGAAFSLTLDPAKLILPAAVVQTGTWGNSGSPSLATPVKNGLALSFNPLSGKFEGSFTRTVNSAPIPTPIQGTLFSRPISIPGGSTLRGAGFFISGNASTAVEVTTP